MHRPIAPMAPTVPLRAGTAAVLPADITMAAAANTTMAAPPVHPAAPPADAAAGTAFCAALPVPFPTVETGGTMIPVSLITPVPAAPVIPAGIAAARIGPGRGLPCRR